METTTPTGSRLATKLAKILGEIGKVEKRGKNQHFGYNYITESDLVHAVREKLSEAGIFVFTSNESQKADLEVGDPDKPDKRARLTHVTLKHTFVDGESGETFSVLSQGQGADKADKGVYKATTGAMKYFIYKCFMIPTGDDPENDGPRSEYDQEPRGSSPHERTSTSSQTRTEEKRTTPEVPRTVSNDLRDKFRNNKWTTVKIHFGKQKGVELAKLESKSLEWWINEWQPKEYNGKFDQADLNLRAALDVANDEWK